MSSYSVLLIKKIIYYASTTDVFLGNLGLYYRAETATGTECSVKTMFLKILQHSQNNACVGVTFLITLLKAAAFSTADLLKKRLQHWFFSLNIVNFLRTNIM